MSFRCGSGLNPGPGTPCAAGQPKKKKKKKKKNLIIAVALVAAEAWIPSPARCSGLKDLSLPQLQHRSRQLEFNSWPGNFHMLWGWSFKKKVQATSTE